jgi:GntR family transcriptional regulator
VSAPPFEPYYVKIMADMRHRIASGEWPPGYQLPPTDQLTTFYREKLGANSSSNVRRAIAELRKTGELRTHQGAGVWVSDQPPDDSPIDQAPQHQ